MSAILLLVNPSKQALRPVRDLPAIKGVAFNGCTVADGDLSPLAGLPPEVLVVPPDRG